MKTSTFLWSGLLVAGVAVFVSPAWAQGGSDNGQMPPPSSDRGEGGPPPFMPSAEEMDTNHDGNVTFEEYTAAGDKVTKDHFKHMDGDNNGVLSKEELTKRPEPPSGQGPRPPAPPNGGGGDSSNRPGPPDGGPRPPSMEDMDANRDGSVSQDEFIVSSHKMSRTQFSKLDANADGVLSKDELAKMRGPGRRGEGPGGPR